MIRRARISVVFIYISDGSVSRHEDMSKPHTNHIPHVLCPVMVFLIRFKQTKLCYATREILVDVFLLTSNIGVGKLRLAH